MEISETENSPETLEPILPSQYDYLTETSNISDTVFHYKIRIKGVATQEQAEKWVQDLNLISQVTWRVSQTFPRSGRINAYSAKFRCHHNINFKKQSNRRSKQTHCPAKLRIIVRRYHKKSRAKKIDPLIKDWPCIVEIINHHNHPIHCADALQYRPVSDGIRQKLKDLFSKGHSPATSHEALIMDLLLEFPDTFDEKSNDRYYLPNLNFCFRQYYKYFNSNTGLRDSEQQFNNLIQNIDAYNARSHEGKAVVVIKNGHVVVAICSPIMSRTHSLIEESCEIMFVTVVAHNNKLNSTVYFFSTNTVIGGIPLGCIVTDTDCHEVFEAGLSALKSILPQEAFYHQGYPAIIMANAELKASLKAEFPNSIFLLCQFHVFRTIWGWLQDKKTTVDHVERLELLQRLKAALYADSEEELLSNFPYEFIENRNAALRHKIISVNVALLWEDRNEWASAYRSLPPHLQLNANGDILFRILQNIILKRTKAFNITQLVDYITSRCEWFTEKRLVDSTCNGQFIYDVLKVLLPLKGSVDVDNIVELQKYLYLVPSEIDANATYLADMDIGICTCPEGSSGRLCKHQTAIIEKFIICDPMICCTPDSHLGNLFHKVALGKSPGIKTDLGAEIPPSQQVVTRPPATAKCYGEEEIQEAECTANLLYLKLRECIRGEPDTFVPAMITMWKNMEKYCCTEKMFSAALGTFAKQPIPIEETNVGVQSLNPPVIFTLQQQARPLRKIAPAGQVNGPNKRPPELSAHDYARSD